MSYRRLGVFAATMMVVAAACNSGGGATPAPTAAPTSAATSAPSASAGCTVGMSWNNYQEERWAKWDEPALKAAIEAGGGTYTSNDAGSSEETQVTNVENLINDGVEFWRNGV